MTLHDTPRHSKHTTASSSRTQCVVRCVFQCHLSVCVPVSPHSVCVSSSLDAMHHCRPLCSSTISDSIGIRMTFVCVLELKGEGEAVLEKINYVIISRGGENISLLIFFPRNNSSQLRVPTKKRKNVCG